MKSSDFSARELFFCTSRSERRNLSLSLESFSTEFESQLKSLSNGSFDFSIGKKENIFFNSNQDKYDYLFQKLVLRKIYRNIESKYKFTHPNRDVIISQMINLTKEKKCPYYILKLDIKSFYESIKSSEIIQNLKKDYRLNQQTMDMLEKLFANQSLYGYTGLPRGLNVSAIMSEIHLQNFDSEIKHIQDVFYYARYVDDIIIFCTSKSSRDYVKSYAEEKLKKLHLFPNMEKTQLWDNNSRNSLTYLGYEFKYDSERKIVISIAPNKIKKIKTRIVISFFDFIKNKDYSLLEKRIKYLTGNCLFEENRSGPLFTGIYYNYKRITQTDVFAKELDFFYIYIFIIIDKRFMFCINLLRDDLICNCGFDLILNETFNGACSKCR